MRPIEHNQGIENQNSHIGDSNDFIELEKSYGARQRVDDCP
jgi:hypothetical protein